MLLPSSSGWVRGPELPERVRNGCLVRLGPSRVVVVGGSRANGQTLNAVFMHDDDDGEDGTWTQLPSYPGPQAAMATCEFVRDDVGDRYVRILSTTNIQNAVLPLSY